MEGLTELGSKDFICCILCVELMILERWLLVDV